MLLVYFDEPCYDLCLYLCFCDNKSEVFFCYLKCTLSPQHSTGKRRPPHGGVGAAVPAVARHPALHGFVLQGGAGSVCGAEGL